MKQQIYFHVRKRKNPVNQCFMPCFLIFENEIPDVRAAGGFSADQWQAEEILSLTPAQKIF